MNELDLQEQYAGYLFFFDESERSKGIIQRIARNQRFSHSVSELDSQVGKTELCLLSADKKSVSGICLLLRGNKTATFEYHAEFTRIFSFPPVRIAGLDDADKKIQHLAGKISVGLSARIPGNTWTGLIQKLKGVGEELAAAIDELDELRKSIGAEYKTKAFEIAAQEKDALGTSVEIFGLDKHKFVPHILPVDVKKRPIPYLDALAEIKSAPVREDVIIAHDAKFFPGWERLEEHQHGTVTFTKRNGERLAVTNVNRQQLEETLGVDLIYYNDTYRSFVFIQYKRMREEGKGNFCYRPNDSCRKQIRRMEEFRKKADVNEPSADKGDFRLSSEMFYFKLCKNIIFTPVSNDWIEGWYVPLDYWNRVGLKAKRFDKDTLYRWFSSSHFAVLVQEGWIGSYAQTTETIMELILQSIGDGNNVVLAQSSDPLAAWKRR
jgi:hypothetical protein